jgi:hypothetical protein
VTASLEHGGDDPTFDVLKRLGALALVLKKPGRRRKRGEWKLAALAVLRGARLKTHDTGGEVYTGPRQPERLTYRSDKTDGPTADTQTVDPLELFSRGR